MLISNEMASRVRAAFDAYIFLSYRKKDRAKANELMRLIHEKKEFRDVAIWYDEFLTPGESFRENIDKMLSDSRLFALLVTPSILEEPDGKPNFVMSREYPLALSSKMKILPAEMERTDREALYSRFEALPEIVDPYDDKAFRERLISSIEKVAKSENDRDPEHNFLIGLAYLDGIDVETNRERGVELITQAAEAKLPEAIMKLREIYKNENKYDKALELAKMLHDTLLEKVGETDYETYAALFDIASIYSLVGRIRESIETFEELYETAVYSFGEDDEETLGVLHALANAYAQNGEFQKALSLQERVYQKDLELHVEDSLDVIVSGANLAKTYADLGDSEKALALNEKIYAISSRFLGEENEQTIIILNNISQLYMERGDFEKALEMNVRAYENSVRWVGEGALASIMMLSNIGICHLKMNNLEKALETCQRAIDANLKIFGEKHPNTLLSLNNIAYVYYQKGDIDRAIEIQESVYEMNRDLLGEEHPNTAVAASNLANSYIDKGDFSNALELSKKAHETLLRLRGERHSHTLHAKSIMGLAYNKLGDLESAIPVYEELLEGYEWTIGDKSLDYREILKALAEATLKKKDFTRSAELFKKLYELRVRALGEKHPDCTETLSDLGFALIQTGDYDQALPLLERALDEAVSEGEEIDGKKIVILYNLAFIYSKKKDERALEAYERAFEGARRIYGEDHNVTVRAESGFASTLYAFGEYARATELYASVQEKREKAFGEESEENLKALVSLSKAHSANKDYESAARVLEKRFGILKRTLPEDHPDLIFSKDELGCYLAVAGRTEEALVLLEDVLEKYKSLYGEDSKRAERTRKNIENIRS